MIVQSSRVGGGGESNLNLNVSLDISKLYRQFLFIIIGHAWNVKAKKGKIYIILEDRNARRTLYKHNVLQFAN